MRRFFILLFPLLVVFFSSCGGDPLDVDVSKISIKQVKLKRLEKDLFSVDTGKIETSSRAFQEKYGEFFEKFVTNVINDGGTLDSTYGLQLKRFLADKDMNDVYKYIQQIYTDEEIEKIENGLTDAFKHARYHFPDTVLPTQFITLMSGFNFNIINSDSTLGLDLEAYMGKEAPVYDMMAQQIPSYRRRLMTKDYILADAVSGWVKFKFDRNDPEKNLLEVMIKSGKLFYCTKALIPSAEDSIIIGYTRAHMDYCNEYEAKLWGHLVEKDRLYTNDLKEIVAYTTDGPFTGAISKECPPAIANYIGYRIVSSYMKRNPGVTLPELMADRDFQKILSKAKYKP